MNITILLTFVLLLVVIVLLMTALKIAGESERFAVFVLGRYESLSGPGLVILAPFIHKALRLRIGDTGVLVSREFCRFGDTDVPVAAGDHLVVGQPVRIDGFEDGAIRLAPAAPQELPGD